MVFHTLGSPPPLLNSSVKYGCVGVILLSHTVFQKRMSARSWLTCPKGLLSLLLQYFLGWLTKNGTGINLPDSFCCSYCRVYNSSMFNEVRLFFLFCSVTFNYPLQNLLTINVNFNFLQTFYYHLFFPLVIRNRKRIGCKK